MKSPSFLVRGSRRSRSTAGDSSEHLSLRPGPRRTLARDQIHVWRASLDQPPEEVVAALKALLSTDELQRAARFYFERDRRRFIVSRGILRRLLSSYIDVPAAEIAFRYGPNGKPALAQGMGLHFNVAHSEDLALFAVTQAGEIGVDVERIREMQDWASIAQHGFSPDELARLHECPPERRQTEFFRAWTRQEAVLKAAGTGLGTTQPPPGTFRVFAVEVGAGFAAALAVADASPRSAFRAIVMDNDDLRSVGPDFL